MYINFLNIFSAKITGKNGTTRKFLLEEYSDYISSKPKNDVSIYIDFIKDEIGKDQYIVKKPVSYDNKGVFIFDEYNKKLRIDFNNLGSDSCKISSDLNFHPPFFSIFFEYISYIEALKKNKILCHSSSFIYNNKVIVCPAWRNVGKTNLLLNFMNKGANYISDDWCMIDAKKNIHRIPKRIHLFDYNFVSNPNILNDVKPSLKNLITLYKGLMDGKYNISETIIKEIKNKLNVRLHPKTLFPSNVTDFSVNINDVFFLKRKNLKNVSIEEIDIDSLVNNLIKVIQFEQYPFRLAYDIHKSRTGMTNLFLEKESGAYRKISKNAFLESNIYMINTPDQSFSNEVMIKILNKIK